MAIDLHSHSTASDGACSPEKLIELGLGLGLSALALTDHDTLDGVERARHRAQGTGLRLICGVEIEIARERGEFHLLGLLLEGDTTRLCQALEGIQAARSTRNSRMVAKFQEAGLPVSMEELQEIAGEKIISRAHFARLLVRKKIANSTDKAFKRYLGKGMPFYEARACLELPDATALIRSAGGIAVIAHPMSLGIHGPALRTFVAACRDQGVEGLEAWHPNHEPKDSRRLERLAAELGMLVTGGSDFHGEHLPKRKLGFTDGDRPIPEAFLEALEARIGSRSVMPLDSLHSAGS
jgi:3',5'-nucleoside bisphosphate phosphatase